MDSSLSSGASPKHENLSSLSSSVLTDRQAGSLSPNSSRFSSSASTEQGQKSRKHVTMPRSDTELISLHLSPGPVPAFHEMDWNPPSPPKRHQSDHHRRRQSCSHAPLGIGQFAEEAKAGFTETDDEGYASPKSKKRHRETENATPVVREDDLESPMKKRRANKLMEDGVKMMKIVDSIREEDGRGVGLDGKENLEHKE